MTFVNGASLGSQTYNYNNTTTNSASNNVYIYNDGASQIVNTGIKNTITDIDRPGALGGSFLDSGNGGYDGFNTRTGNMTENGGYNAVSFTSYESGKFILGANANHDNISLQLGGTASADLSNVTNTGADNNITVYNLNKYSTLKLESGSKIISQSPYGSDVFLEPNGDKVTLMGATYENTLSRVTGYS